MSEWHPIETAPRMKPVIVWSAEYGMAMAYWSDLSGKWFVSCSGYAVISLDWNPTRWTELPNPPGD